MLRLKAVVADVDLVTLISVLQILKDCSTNPQKVSTHRLVLRSQRDREVVHIEAEFADSDVTVEALRLIAAKIAQMPITLSTVFGQDSGSQTLCTPTLRP
jgi:hypothetical protein